MISDCFTSAIGIVRRLKGQNRIFKLPSETVVCMRKETTKAKIEATATDEITSIALSDGVNPI